MIAQKDENFCEASESLFILNADDITRQKCRAREDQLRLQHKMEHKIDVLTEENEALTQKNNALAKKNDTLAQENEALKQLLKANNIDYNQY